MSSYHNIRKFWQHLSADWTPFDVERDAQASRVHNDIQEWDPISNLGPSYGAVESRDRDADHTSRRGPVKGTSQAPSSPQETVPTAIETYNHRSNKHFYFNIAGTDYPQPTTENATSAANFAPARQDSCTAPAEIRSTPQKPESTNHKDEPTFKSTDMTSSSNEDRTPNAAPPSDPFTSYAKSTSTATPTPSQTHNKHLPTNNTTPPATELAPTPSPLEQSDTAASTNELFYSAQMQPSTSRHASHTRSSNSSSSSSSKSSTKDKAQDALRRLFQRGLDRERQQGIAMPATASSVGSSSPSPPSRSQQPRKYTSSHYTPRYTDITADNHPPAREEEVRLLETPSGFSRYRNSAVIFSDRLKNIDFDELEPLINAWGLLMMIVLVGSGGAAVIWWISH